MGGFDIEFHKLRSVDQIESPLRPTRMNYTSPIPFLMDRPLVWMTRMYLLITIGARISAKINQLIIGAKIYSADYRPILPESMCAWVWACLLTL